MTDDAATDLVEELTFNEMRVRVSGGSRRYVLVTTEAAEPWQVDHHTLTVEPNDVVGFHNDTDALHFINQGRASDLGRFANMEELRAAYAAQKPKKVKK
jgi:hypothetical protein